MADRRRAARRMQIALATGVAVAVVGGGALVFWGLKAAERQAYAAYVQGPPCRAVAATPAYVDPARLKSVEIGAASFRFLRGDADCTVLKPGLMSGDEERPVCRLDHPGYVEARTPAGTGRFVIVAGQASLAATPSGPRCVVQPSA
jgi:hypothetical protein